jgi:hypothetical protein
MKGRGKSLWIISAAVLALVASTPWAWAQGQGAAAQMTGGEYDDWNYGFELRSWLTMFSGDVTARGNDTSVDIDFGDLMHLLDELQFIFDGHVEVKKGPFGLILDGFYVNLEDQSGLDFAVPVLVPPIGTVEIPLKAKLDVLSEIAYVEGAFAYDIWTSSSWRGGWPVWRLEALAGGRYYYLRTRIEADLTGPRGTTVPFELDGSRDWVDPIVGGRFSWRPAEGWLVGLRSDFGGFTIGSDFAWNVEATVEYQLANWLYVDAGYRALYADYEQGSFKYDVWTHGPWIGIGFKF